MLEGGTGLSTKASSTGRSRNPPSQRHWASWHAAGLNRAASLCFCERSVGRHEALDHWHDQLGRGSDRLSRYASQKLRICDEVPMNRGRQDRRRDAPRRFASRRYEASAAFAAIVAWAHQTSSFKADFAAPSRLASLSSMGLFAPIGEVDMKSAPPMWTEAAVETIRSAIAMRRRCSTARDAPSPPW